MISDAPIGDMLETALSTFQSAFDALSRIEDSNKTPSSDRQFIMDSFHVNRLTKAFKDWEERNKKSYLETEARGYNKQVGEIARVNTEVEALEANLERTLEKNTLPNFAFSISTIENYNDGEFLKYLTRDENGHYQKQVRTSEIFSLDVNSKLAEPEFEVFNRLINIEARIRLQKKIVCEILIHTKNQLASRNRKWSSRDTSLQEFLEATLPGVFTEIEKVRNEIRQEAERKDNKDVDMEHETDFDEQENNDEDMAAPEQNDEAAEAQDETSSKPEMMDLNE
ncbi:hypothetical protein QA089_000090 [Meyerozyma guilliermondii]